MEKKEATQVLGLVLYALALMFAAAAVAKMFGLIPMRPSVIELAAVSIALSLAK